ncbi:hypothetical protein ACKAV7_014706 [Fusarium commune]
MAGARRRRRRSHPKSRKGCDTCRNCTRHKFRCPYNDVLVTHSSVSSTPDKPDLIWTPQIEVALIEWKRTGIFPLPCLSLCPTPRPHLYSLEDLRLIHHLATLYCELGTIDANNFTLWTHHIPTLLQIGATTPFVMHALLAFSAMHIHFLTDCPLVGGMVYEHRGIALKGLQKAINLFSHKTSDAVLAASFLLSWQATDWRTWIQLMQGTSKVIDAMDSWKHESQFGDFIAESGTFPMAPPSPGKDLRPRADHLGAGSRKISRTLSIAQQFEYLQPLRTWLFWRPVNHLLNSHGSPNSLVVTAHLYTVALLMERLFPEVGAAYFGSLTISPIEEITRRLMSINVSNGSKCELQTPLKLIVFLIDMVDEFRSRMGRAQPDGTPSAPQHDPSNSNIIQEMRQA